MLSCAGSNRWTHAARSSRQGRPQVQLSLPFIEFEEAPASAVIVWDTLEADQRAAVLAILTRLMVKAIAPKEAGDE
jgi:hypothetical protein